MEGSRVLVIGAHHGSAIHHQILKTLDYAGAHVVIANEERPSLSKSDLAAFIVANRHIDDPIISLAPKNRTPWYAAYGMRRKKGKLCHR